MCDDFKEIFAKEKADLSTIVQEWINENIEEITCKCRERTLEYNQGLNK